MGRPDATEPDGQATSLLTPRQIVIQLAGFAIGLVFLAWCIKLAITGGDWSKLAQAKPALVAGLAGCSVISLFVNGVIFWLVVQPVRPLRFRDLQWLNLSVSLLNYAPIRAGLIARVAYHLRVDRMSMLHIGAWLAAVACTLLLARGACVAATIVWPHFDGIWLAIILGQVALGGLLTTVIVGQPIFVRYGRGMDQMLRRPACLWGALALRLVDIGAFTGRMACAAAIMDLGLAAPDVLLLAFASLALSLNPLGRFGFREMAVTIVASRLLSMNLSGEQIDGQLAQLALIESAGEALVAVPLGAVALWWYRRRWRQAKQSAPTT
ncbi:MAG: hypothetical protein ACYTGG_04845 [Planctomycetota bacterium]|jgi:hypothetical protein